MPVTRHTTPVSSIKKEREPEKSDMEQLLEKITSLQVTQRGNNGGHAMPSYKENESFSTFIRKVNNYLNYIGADETYAIRILPIMLAGPWVSLLDALQREIYSEDRILLAQAELASVKQKTAKVEIFAKICKELAERAYPFDEKAREAFLLATFINRLNSKLRTAIRRATPSSFESAVNAASHEEVILRLSEEGDSSAMHALAESINAMNTQPEAREKRHRERSQRSNGYRPNYKQYQDGRNHFNNGKARDNRRKWRKDPGRDNSRSPRDANAVNPLFTPESPAQSGSRRILDSISAITVTVCCIIALSGITSIEVETLYACQNARGGILVAPPRPQECNPPKAETILHTRIEIYIKNHTMEEYIARRCSKEIYRRCMNGRIWIPDYNQTLREVSKKCIYRLMPEKGLVGILQDKTVVSSLMTNTGGCKIQDGATSIMLEATQNAFLLDNGPIDYWIRRCFKQRVHKTTTSALFVLIDYPKISNISEYLIKGRRELSRNGYKYFKTEELIQALLHHKHPRISQLITGLSEENKRKEVMHQMDEWRENYKGGNGPGHYYDAYLNDIFNVREVKRRAKPIEREEINHTIVRAMEIWRNSDNIHWIEEAHKSIKEPTSTVLTSRTTTTKATTTTTTTKASTMTTAELIQHQCNAVKQVRPLKGTTKQPDTATNDQKARFARQNSTPTPVERSGVIGKQSHLNYMQKQYDMQENLRRNLTMTGTNDKLQYFTEMLQKDMKSNLDRVCDTICNINNRQLETWWAIMQLDPTTGLRAMLKRKDITARIVGSGILSITQCRKVIANRIHYDHKLNDTCYAYVPIITREDEIMYLIPGSTDVSTSSNTINEEGGWSCYEHS
uniref:Reverse transcriptase domain-containing protein n=1 Tax=Heterorhabditis bacteriophora TaxID=37862 RepID=A0A1I7XE47_HETBA